jgi:hypothetical protein
MSSVFTNWKSLSKQIPISNNITLYSNHNVIEEVLYDGVKVYTYEYLKRVYIKVVNGENVITYGPLTSDKDYNNKQYTYRKKYKGYIDESELSEIGSVAYAIYGDMLAYLNLTILDMITSPEYVDISEKIEPYLSEPADNYINAKIMLLYLAPGAYDKTITLTCDEVCYVCKYIEEYIENYYIGEIDG